MARAMSLWMAKTSSSGLSYCIAHSWASVWASINRTETRTSLPARCTSPSTTWATPSCAADLGQVALAGVPVLQNRRAADDFQIRDLRQIGEDFVLHAIGEVFVGLVVAQVLEGQDGHRLRRDGRQGRSGRGGKGGDRAGTLRRRGIYPPAAPCQDQREGQRRRRPQAAAFWRAAWWPRPAVGGRLPARPKVPWPRRVVRLDRPPGRGAKASPRTRARSA